jgi:hypothetical protein
VCSSDLTTAFGVGPACATTASAMKVLDLEAVPYFVDVQLPVFVPLSLLMSLVLFCSSKSRPKVRPGVF